MKDAYGQEINIGDEVFVHATRFMGNRDNAEFVGHICTVIETVYDYTLIEVESPDKEKSYLFISTDLEVLK